MVMMVVVVVVVVVLVLVWWCCCWSTPKARCTPLFEQSTATITVVSIKRCSVLVRVRLLILKLPIVAV